MKQYKTQYGTIFAVKEHNGAPAIMCRAELSEIWSLSSMIEPFTPGAWTAEELQGQLDSWAATKGWTPFEEPASAEPPESVDEGSGSEDGCPYLQPLENSRKYTCQCSISGDKFANREICNKSYLGCGWYQDRQEKDVQPDDEEVEPPATDACQCRTCEKESCFAHGCNKECPANAEESCLTISCPEYIEQAHTVVTAVDGFPDWVRPMVEAFLQFPFFRELPAFTAFAIRHSESVQHHQGGSLADGLYDTGPKGIKFSVFRDPNSDQYREASYTWANFVRRCKAEGLVPEAQPKDKEGEPCNTETAPTGAAAATTTASAAAAPSKTAETTTTSESGAVASTSSAPPSPAEASPAASREASMTAVSTAQPSAALPVFDYTGLDDQTVQDLHLAEREISGGKRMAEIGLRRMADGVAIAHDALCGACDNLSQAHNNQHSEKTFGRWCDSVGLNRKAAERLLQVSKLFDDSTPREQKVLEELGPSLLYAAAKPSAPADLVQAVKDGDITTHKQYQDLLAKYDEERAARAKAEKASKAMTECYNVAHKNEEFTLKNLKSARAERDAALQRATAAENRAAGAQKLAEQRGAENTDLKAQIRELESRPVEVAIAQPGDAQIEAWRKEGEDRAAAALQDSIRKANQAKADAQRQVADLQNQLAAARPDADACQRTVDTLYETTENLRLLLRAQLQQAQLPPATYGSVVAHVLQAAGALRDTVRSCAPAGYDFDSEEDDDFE